MDTLPNGVSDDVDLDALMARVREAAMSGGTSGLAAPAPIAGDLTGRDAELMRVIAAQGEWNEHTRKSLEATVECLRNLRDDWVSAHSRIRQEIERLSARVEQMHAVEQKNARPKAPRRRVAAKRRRPHKVNGRRG